MEIGEDAAALGLRTWDGLSPVLDGGELWVTFVGLYPHHEVRDGDMLAIPSWDDGKGLLVTIGWPGIEVPVP